MQMLESRPRMPTSGTKNASVSSLRGHLVQPIFFRVFLLLGFVCFLVYHSDFSIFTKLYNHHYYLIPQYFHYSKKKLIPSSIMPPFPFFSAPGNHQPSYFKDRETGPDRTVPYLMPHCQPAAEPGPEARPPDTLSASSEPLEASSDLW